MKTRTKRLLIIVALLAALGIGFFAGKAAERRETVQNRLGQGRTKLFCHRQSGAAAGW